jgi:aspartyl-tRNA(Asn)/glutamyl-tRNA(Gln) amidotransferase subunit C
MALTAKDVTQIAHLARLAINEADIPLYTSNLTDILAMVTEINTVDTKGIIPMAHPLDTSQRFRPDKITEHDQRDYFQKIAPKAEAGLYLVPKVIE